MNIDDGSMRKLSPELPLRDDEVFVPPEKEEALVNMTRQQRRAWARKERKRLEQKGG